MKLNLNLSEVSTMGSRVVLATGQYNTEIIKVEAKETKAKTGGYLQATFKVVNGDNSGVTFTENFNVSNQNADAVRIALSSIKTILTVGGHKNPNMLVDSDELIGLKVAVFLEEVPHSFTGSDGKQVETTQNNVKGYFTFDDKPKVAASPVASTGTVSAAPNPFAAAPAPQSTQAPAAAPAIAAAPGLPWQN